MIKLTVEGRCGCTCLTKETRRCVISRKLCTPSYLLVGKSQWAKIFHETAQLPYAIALVHTGYDIKGKSVELLAVFTMYFAAKSSTDLCSHPTIVYNTDTTHT
ncbi:hypothetical protein L873DRAFT_493608 [Choiromyces venosus 120613-1]|uniref:Uncharacterized protein n=1 Tax=Choiromyces venosus 120613-1 TaxID=1336337 RepID=A0A3N4K8D1_9PEZI|nr:hypothetical protein L873DRAFT_493608 [Choiromyces venosus 120613-1]